MLRRLTLALPLMMMVVPVAFAGPDDDDKPEKKFGDFAKLTKGAKEIDGLFKLYHKDDHVYMELQPHQFDKPLLAPIAIARGLGSGGSTLNDDDQWVLMFRRVGDKVHLIRRNVRYQAKAGTPAAKAVETTYADSVIMALKIAAINQNKNAPVIDLNDIFFTDFARLPLGSIDQNRTVWQKVKGYAKNIELQVAATYTGGRTESGVIDSRGKTVVIHYGLVEIPEGYTPRLADNRVGYFLTAVKDFSNESRETSFVRYVNRWRLERADGTPWKEGAKIVPPKKKIVFWIEKSVPDEYRSAVREGILEWNKAFEAIGFRDAIEVRQQENEDFDPEDINYNTFRWTTHDQGYAIGPSRANPLTGEILDADILFDASMVRYWKTSHLVQRPGKGYDEPASLIQAAQRGWLMPRPSLVIGQGGWDARADDPEEQLRLHFQMFRQGMCQCASQKRFELGLAAMTWIARNPGEKVPEDLIVQSIKETTMHEVGHTLGLRHNFKASTMLKSEQLHDTAITRKKGLVGSVMDYNPVNLAPKGAKQGDYFSLTIGPYDFWAIEYGYKPLSGGSEGEVEELKKIASKSAQAGLDYGTDEDLMAGPDPLCNQWDLGSDPMKYAQERIVLSEELLKGLADRIVEKGDSYQATRGAFSLLLRQYGDGAYLVSRHIGGVELHRDHKGDADGRDPFVPLTGARQRNALKFLQQHILTDQPFNFPPELLRKLAADRWMHWGNEQNVMRNVDFTLYDRILRIQAVVLDELLDPATLSRIQNNTVRGEKDDQPLTVAEVFRALTDSVWEDLPNGDKSSRTSSVVRRNIQREYLSRLTRLVLGQKSGADGFFAILLGGTPTPPDALSLARMHLRDTTRRIDVALADKKFAADDTTRAHLEECKERIAKVLSASMQVKD